MKPLLSPFRRHFCITSRRTSGRSPGNKAYSLLPTPPPPAKVKSLALLSRLSHYSLTLAPPLSISPPTRFSYWKQCCIGNQEALRSSRTLSLRAVTQHRHCYMPTQELLPDACHLLLGTERTFYLHRKARETISS